MIADEDGEMEMMKRRRWAMDFFVSLTVQPPLYSKTPTKQKRTSSNKTRPWAERTGPGPWAGPDEAASYGAGSCACCSIAVARRRCSIAIETRGIQVTDAGVLGVEETTGSRAASAVGLGVVDGIGSVRGLRATSAASLSGDGDAGIGYQ